MFTTRVDGIDVAHYQSEHGAEVDWPVVRAHCARPDFSVASFKVCQGTRVDPFFLDNRHDVAAAGFRWRIGYPWLVPTLDPIRQAKFYLDNFDASGPNEGCCLDAEQAGITEAEAFEFVTYVEGATRKPMMVYCGVYTAGGTIWRSTRIFNGRRVRWVAAYEPEPKVRAATQPFGFDAWQGDGGATGTFPGVVGPVDLDMVEHPIMFDLACGITTAPKPPPTTPQPTPARGEFIMIGYNSEPTMATDWATGQPASFGPGIAKFEVEYDRTAPVGQRFTATQLHPQDYECVAGGPETPLTNAQLRRMVKG